VNIFFFMITVLGVLIDRAGSERASKRIVQRRRESII